MSEGMWIFIISAVYLVAGMVNIFIFKFCDTGLLPPIYVGALLILLASRLLRRA